MTQTGEYNIKQNIHPNSFSKQVIILSTILNARSLIASPQSILSIAPINPNNCDIILVVDVPRFC